MLCIDKVKSILVIILIFLSVFSFTESVLIVFWGTRLSELTLQLLLGTNFNEALGFVSQYIFTFKFFFFFSCLALGCKIVVTCLRKIDAILNIPSSAWLVVVIILFSVINIYRDCRFINLMRNNDVQTITDERDKMHYAKNYTTIGLVIYSLRINSVLSNDNELLKRTLSQGRLLHCNYHSPHIAVIIGESFNKYHSNLYGYKLLTNPYLTKELINGNLYVCHDVATPFNTTYRSLKSIMSFSSQDNDIIWTDKLLFPAVFKNAGYRVNFISNQEVKSEYENIFDVFNNYLVDAEIAKYLFDYQNAQKYYYDSELVKEHVEILNNSFSSPSITIFHLLGQHHSYADRYPNDFENFNVSDYKYRTDLNVEQKKVVSNYDNATLYNDLVISQIIDLYRSKNAIIIYLSDHGEEVFDFRDRAGRCHDEIIIPERAKYEYSVPFMFWVSNEYKNKHPQIINSISEASNKPFMIDDLPHLLLDLAGIEYEAFDNSRSMINSSYNALRVRCIEDSKQNYDDLIRCVK